VKAWLPPTVALNTTQIPNNRKEEVYCEIYNDVSGHRLRALNRRGG
jgi:hypothetical protein